MGYGFMKIIDISLEINDEMPIYPGDTQFIKKPICTIDTSGCNMMELLLSTHTGTHIDASYHFIKTGARIDEIELSTFIGKTQVIEVKGDTIDAHVIEQSLKPEIKRVLFKTSNSSLLKSKSFSKNYVYLNDDGADSLVDKGIILVGIDYISIERFGTQTFSVHKKLFKAGITILEGINLTHVEAKEYTLIAFPLKLKGLDGSPVRAVLIES